MTREDIPAVVELMALAFQNAALYRYLEPDGERRAALLRTVFSARLPFGFDGRDGELALSGSGVAGAALWMRPEAAHEENHALEQAVERYGGALYEKWKRFHSLLFESLGAACEQPHWSLAPIAVLPSAQGRGVAGALLRRKLNDTGGARCLLATQDRVNTGIYARYGFNTVSETVIAAAGASGPELRSWVMLRR
jgi:GNAT superfamily N-acetyltransferase